jgi:hypothetical protein
MRSIDVQTMRVVRLRLTSLFGLPFVLSFLVSCGSKEEPAAPTPTPTPSPSPSRTTTTSTTERPNAPSREQCERAADHLNSFVVESLAPGDAPEADRKYVAGLTSQRREAIISFCLATSNVDEANCMIEASDFPTLAACERFRRQVPPELLERTKVTEADCELFFYKLRLFKLTEGVAAAEIEKDKDKLVATCMEKAKPGTLVCFLAARDYAQAKSCP